MNTDNMRRRAAFVTLGCKVNQSETQGIAEQFEAAGYIIADPEESADVYVVNTCSVTAMSESKGRQIISRLHRRNPEACIAVTGCYAQRAGQELLGLPGVEIAVGTNHKAELVRLCTRYLDNKAGNRPADKKDCKRIADYKAGSRLVATETEDHCDFEELPISRHEGHTRAYMKIEDGCDSFCSYCIIPYLRGPVRSRSLEAISAEAHRLAQNGFCEIVLGGIHLTSYGRDTGCGLEDAVKAVAAVPGIKRIRLGSLEPMGVTKSFLDAVAETDKLCPQFHLSLQSGCDSVLERMNRRYTAEQYAGVCRTLREYYPGCAISTDIIVGFPGETDAEFEQTCRFVEETGFASVHVFSFSPRQGTAAADMPGQVAHAVKKEREHILLQQCLRQRQEYLSGFIGREETVLVERSDGQVSRGLTPQHAEALIKGGFEPGEIVRVRVESVSEGCLQCEPADKK